LSLLFTEPSSAGYFYCFVFFILSINYFKSSFKLRFISQGFRYLGILIFSKGQLIALALLSILKLKLKGILIILVIIITLLLVYPRISTFLPEQLTKTVTETQIFSYFILKNGISGLSSTNEVAATYVTRISSVFYAFNSIAQFPFGIGFGTYDYLFSEILKKDRTTSSILSMELYDISAGHSYGSPRSNLLEVIISSGLIAFFALIMVFKFFYKYRKSHKEIYNAFLLFLLASLFLEQNSFFVMLTFLIVILKSQINIEKALKFE